MNSVVDRQANRFWAIFEADLLPVSGEIFPP